MDQLRDTKEEELTYFSEESLEANNNAANDAVMQQFSSNINSPIISFFKIVIYLLLQISQTTWLIWLIS